MGGESLDLDNSEFVRRIMAERKASVRNVESNAADYVRIMCPQCGKPEHGTASCEIAPGWDAPYELTVYPGSPPKPTGPPNVIMSSRLLPHLFHRWTTERTAAENVDVVRYGSDFGEAITTYTRELVRYQRCAICGKTRRVVDQAIRTRLG